MKKPSKFTHSRNIVYAFAIALVIGFLHGLVSGNVVEGISVYVTVFGSVILGWFGLANYREFKEKELETAYELEEEDDA